MQNWTLAKSGRGIQAIGKLRLYRITDDPHVIRPKRVVLLVQPNGGKRSRYVDCYDHVAQAIRAADAMETA